MSKYRNKNGFSLLEFIIAIILVGLVITILFSITVTGVKNGRFVQRLADVRTLASQKATQLFNDIPNQVKNFPVGQTQAGSLDPNNPVNGYFDLLNDSGCLINSSVVVIGKGSTPTQDLGGGSYYRRLLYIKSC